MRHSRLFLRCLFLMTLLAAAAPAYADLIIVFGQSNQPGAPGSTLTYSGTVQNTDPANAVDLLSGNPNVDPGAPATPTDISTFSSNTLNPNGTAGDTTNGTFFSLLIDSNAVPGTYGGTYSIDYNSPSGSANQFTSTPQAFTFTVTPEPSTWAMMSLGLAGVIGVHRRRKKNTPAAPAPDGTPL